MSTLLIGVLGYIGSHIASKSKAKSVLGWEPNIAMRIWSKMPGKLF